MKQAETYLQICLGTFILIETCAVCVWCIAESEVLVLIHLSSPTIFNVKQVEFGEHYWEVPIAVYIALLTFSSQRVLYVHIA